MDVPERSRKVNVETSKSERKVTFRSHNWLLVEPLPEYVECHQGRIQVMDTLQVQMSVVCLYIYIYTCEKYLHLSLYNISYFFVILNPLFIAFNL